MSITSGNSIITLAIASLYTVPQQLQGFAADSIFESEQVSSAEIVVGLDGSLSAGYVPAPVKQTFHFQADSPSIDMFEAWHAAQKAALDIYKATAVITMPSTGRIYTCTNGILSSYSPLPDARKVLQARKFTITWESVIGVSS